MKNMTEERKGFEILGLSYAPNSNVHVERVILAGIENYWFTPANITSNEVVVYLHGGAFTMGSIKSHKAMVSHIANAMGRKILFVEYSLAPEKSFPAALHEATAVIQALLQATPALQFGIMGDSCGGNLALSTALNLKNRNLPLPRYQVLISPWLNLENNYPSYVQNEKLDPILTKAMLDGAMSLYAGTHDLKNPLLSPVQGSLTGLSPTLTMVGAKEILRDDSIYLHEALEQAGATSILKILDDVTHVWPLTDIESRDSKEALRIIVDFLNTVSVELVHN
ncbi:MAG TPA: alpha/beta hydrolase [Cyclobacteriaceae bacterium]|jgi:acetyl esterase/lipase|nr:alpha/beta hydrolase [Cyclobacteriaceae bacterium]